MMIHNKFVVAIKHNGKILREIGDVVKLPFGSEFTVLVKNLNSRRAKFTLHIDGVDVLDGTSIIVNANSEVEMKRFIRNGNMNEGNAFKFIERTQAIEDGPRGIKMDDGVIRVEFWLEKEAPVVNNVYTKEIWSREYRHPFGGPSYGGPYYGGLGGTFSDSSAIYTSKGVMRGSSMDISGSIANLQNSTLSSATATSANTLETGGGSVSRSLENLSNEAGITVPGSKVEQKFTSVYGFNAEIQSHVIILRMIGRVGDTEVSAPITVKTTQRCSTCGKVNKATSKFCTDCGTSLISY